MSKRKSQSPDIHALLQDGFSKETARELYAQGEEIAIFVMMQLAALAKKSVEVNGVHLSEPSGTVATYLKEPAKQRRKKPGAKPGHQGSHRPPPENITHHVKHIAKCCPYYVIVDIFNTQFYFKLTAGGLVHVWHNLAAVLKVWYEQIRESAMQSGVLHGDETGWRVNGKTHWLWCFTTQNETYYVIDKSRGSPVVKRFFRKAFDGILIRAGFITF